MKEGFEDRDLIQAWRKALSHRRCESQENSDNENETNNPGKKKSEHENEEGDETWLRGGQIKIDDGVVTLLEEDGSTNQYPEAGA